MRDNVDVDRGAPYHSGDYTSVGSEQRPSNEHASHELKP